MYVLETNKNVQQLFDECVLINNAGSLGHIGVTTDSPSLQDLQQTVNLNVTAALWLSVRVARYCKEHVIPHCTIVNVSSLVAIQPFATLAIYSAGKAARDAFHSSMAQEEEAAASDDTTTTTRVRVLNYAPGPLEGTDMTQQLRQADRLDATLQPQYQKTLVDVNDSATALVQLWERNNYKNGQHVDYYDTLEGAIV